MSDQIASLEISLKQDPSSPDFHRLADAYTRAGRYDDAIRVSEQGIKFHPELVEGHIALARALVAAGKSTGAIKALRQAIRLKSAHPEPYRLLGEILLWQKHPAEALQLIERAIQLGHHDNAILDLLDRARNEVSSTLDITLTTPADYLYHQNNHAVAGTIVPPNALDQEEYLAEKNDTFSLIESEVTHRVPSGQLSALKALLATKISSTNPSLKSDEDHKSAHFSGGDQKPKPRIKWPGASNEGGKTKRQYTDNSFYSSDPTPVYSSDPTPVQAKWEKSLDAKKHQSFDIDSDVIVPHTIPKIDLPPLTDPLTEKMPPLPEDTEVNVSINLDGRLSSIEAHLSPSDVSSSAPISQSQPIARDEAPPLGQRTPSLFHSDRPQQSERFRDLTEDQHDTNEHLDITIPPESLADGDITRQYDTLFNDADLSPEDEDQSITEEQILPLAIQTETKSQTSPRLILLLIITIIISGASWLGVHLYRSIYRGHQALKTAKSANISGTFEGYIKAVKEMSQVAANSLSRYPHLTEQSELLNALAWLQYGAGESSSFPSPAGQSPSPTYPLAQAALALAKPEIPRAQTLLNHESYTPIEQSTKEFLLAWAAWLEGNEIEVEKRLNLSFSQRPEIAGAYVLSGHLFREKANLRLAEQAYRKALTISPDHELARFGLAAVLLAHEGSVSSEVQNLLAKNGSSPVGKAWHNLLRLEALLKDDQFDEAVKNISPIIMAALSDPAILFYGVQVMIHAGQFDEALAILNKLKSIRAAGNQRLALLEADLELAQGLEAKVIDTLQKQTHLPQANLLHAFALMITDQPQAALAILAQDNSQTANEYRMMAKALLEDKAALTSLNKLAKDSAEAKRIMIFYALKHHDSAAARSWAMALAKSPPWRNIAQTLLAQSYWENGNIERALSLLVEVERISPKFLPAQELLGRIYFSAGQHQQAAQKLSLVRQMGRTSLSLVKELVKVHALNANMPDAINALKEVKQLGASRDDLMRLMAYIQLAEGSLKRAAEMMGEQAEIPFLIALGKAYLKNSNDTQKAEALFIQAMIAAPSHPLPYLQLGNLYAVKKPTTAVEYLEKSLKQIDPLSSYLKPMAIETHLSLTRIYLQIGPRGWLLAVNHAQAAIELDKKNAVAFRMLGESLLALHRTEEAKQALEQSAALDPTDGTSLFLLARAYQNEPGEARNILKRFLKLEPTGERADKAKKLLQKHSKSKPAKLD